MSGSGTDDPKDAEGSGVSGADPIFFEISEDENPVIGNSPASFRGNVVGEIDEFDRPDASLTVRTKTLSLPEQRYRLAKYMLALVGLLGFMIIGSAFFASDESYAQVKELAPIIFSPLVTLLGTCVAWYYASNKKD